MCREDGGIVILYLTILWLVGRSCYGTWLFCYEGYGASSQSPAAGVGGISPDVMSPGQAAFCFQCLGCEEVSSQAPLCLSIVPQSHKSMCVEYVSMSVYCEQSCFNVGALFLSPSLTICQVTYGSFDYTSLLYLSDYGSDFTGGRFVFMDQNGNRTVEPRTGNYQVLKTTFAISPFQKFCAVVTGQ